MIKNNKNTKITFKELGNYIFAKGLKVINSEERKNNCRLVELSDGTKMLLSLK